MTNAPDVFSNIISDGAHNGGTAGFHFLTPMVANPSTTGTFDTGLLPYPTVRACELGPTECVLPALLEFTSESGSGSDVLRVGGDHYIVNWYTGEFNLDAAKTHRIEVEVNESVIGFADVNVVTKGGALRSAETGDFIALLDNRTLPIKFRIEALTETAFLFKSVSAGGFRSCGLATTGAASLRNAVDAPPPQQEPCLTR